jgi:hypothetical protein
MEFFTVSLFGHRQIEDLRLLEKRLKEIIQKITNSDRYISFLIGRHGEFDEFTASVIKRHEAEARNENYDMTLILPYSVADIEYYEEYYDGVDIPSSIQALDPKSVIEARNRWMIEHSDLVIVWVERNYGGAYKAMKYAKKLGKRIINLCENKDII